VDPIADIINRLEQQQAAIDGALTALRGIAGSSRSTAPNSNSKVGRPVKRQRRLSAEGRRKIAEAARKRWAAIKAAKGAPTPASEKIVKRRGGRKKAGVNK